ncbi:MAG: SAM-dependent chlorinase/fluorinase [Bacteroidales bacterium]|jgi:S-adenosylmethionine hydrolase|nr:SAM-dependent chlorinase/fluorinase [Bacteroidales bacterium]
MSPIVTLISDWQDNDYYIAAVKGRLISYIPDVTIVDITHKVPRGDLVASAYLLRNAYHNFPKGAIHIIGIMDIESKKSPHIVVNYDGHYFIGADNGQFHDIFSHEPEQVFEITSYQEGTSFTFPSRDRFPIVAASIINDNDLSKIGVPSALRARSKEPFPMYTRKKENEIIFDVPVLYVDAAGNTVLNITREIFSHNLKEYPFFSIKIGVFYSERDMKRELLRIDKISEAYQDVDNGSGCALFLDNGYLELSINNGSFQELAGLDMYSTVKIEFSTVKIL